MPAGCPGVDAALLNPRSTWASPEAYDETADRLARMFQENFLRRYPYAPEEIKSAGPRPLS